MRQFISNHFILIIAISILLSFVMFSCSPQKLRLPIQEIDRPLSLPPGAWRIGLGAGLFINPDTIGKPYLFMNPLFEYPYFQLGSKCEYYLPARFKYYVFKNTEIKDSMVFIKGSNCAVEAGVTSASYSQVDNWNIGSYTAIDFKAPINDKIWIVSKLSVNFQTSQKYFDGDIGAGIGYQITKQFYATIAPSFSYSNYTIVREYFRINDAQSVGKTIWNDGKTGWILPVLVGANVSDKWSIYLKTNSRFYSGGNRWITSAVGAQCTW